MTPTAVNYLFVLSIAFAAAARFWLLSRQRTHIARHCLAVPPAFSARIDLTAHQKAAKYSGDLTRLGQVGLIIDTAFLLLVTVGGGLNFLADRLPIADEGGLLHGLLLFGAFGLVSTLWGLPLEWYRIFVIEQRYGFNKLSLREWLVDGLKGLLLGGVIGAPLLAAILWFMAKVPDTWWLYAWAVWMGFNLTLLWAYPVFIAPIFNKFTPLADIALAQRLNNLLHRCGFRTSGLYVMDGSRRSAHGNAYFTGFGAAKRIVLYDTLINMLSPAQIEAVLAHELGHFVRRHVIKRVALASVLSLCALWLIAQLIASPAFFNGLGVTETGTAIGLLLALLWLPALSFPMTPLLSLLSRKHEYEADQYAAAQSSAVDLIEALVAMYRENAATLTPDPLHSLFYDSHPPAALRIAHLEAYRAAPASQ